MAHISRLYLRGHLGPGPLLLSGDQAKRLSTVMRLRAGERFLVFSGDGREWEATVTAAGQGRLQAVVGAIARQEAASPLVVEAWVGLVRPNRFDWALEKLVEAGADVIRPLLTEHAARGDGASVARLERWDRIAVEAAEQCGRLRLAVVEPPASFGDLLGRHRDALVVAAREGRPWPEIAALLPPEGNVALAIGPEGGFSEGELARARAHGALLACLGPNILRTETAAVIATGLVRAR